jgi:hypothetical protein
MSKMKSKGRELITAAAKSASAIATRFASVEVEATRIHQEKSGASLVRALLKGGKLHAVVSDGKSTLEVMDGAVALSVAQDQ